MTMYNDALRVVGVHDGSVSRWLAQLRTSTRNLAPLVQSELQQHLKSSLIE